VGAHRPVTAIDTLEAKGLVSVAAYRPELEYLFRHSLVQDAAYGSLLKQERRQLHRLVGEALEELYPEQRNELSGVLAMHFEQAGDAARAVDYLRKDGTYALDRAALREAFAAFDRAIALLPRDLDTPEVDEATQRLRIELEVLRARVGIAFRPLDEVAAELGRVIPAAERIGDLELLVQVHLYMTLALVEGRRPADDPLAQRSMERLRELGEALDDPSLAALPLAMVGMDKVFTGPVPEGVEALERAIPLMEKRSDFIGAAFSRGWLAMGYATLGEFDLAESAAQAALDEAADGDPIGQLDAQISLAMVRSVRGDLDEAGPLASICLERSEETGAAACGMVSSWILGDVYQRQQRFGEAHDALLAGLAMAPPGPGLGMWSSTLRAWLRVGDEHLGRASVGLDWDEELAAARARHDALGEAAILWKRAETDVARGDPGAALGDFEAAATITAAQGARPNHARIQRAWGEALRLAGRDAEGDDRLRTALAALETLGLAREAEEIRAELPTGGEAAVPAGPSG